MTTPPPRATSPAITSTPLLDPTHPLPTRVELIRGSLRCFVLGLCSLIPFLGLLFAVVCTGCYIRVERNSADAWNPARAYQAAGLCLATVGGLASLLAWALLIIGIYQAW